MATVNPLNKTIDSLENQNQDKKKDKEKSKSTMQTQFSTALTRLTGSFLDCPELAQYSKTARFARNDCREDLGDRKRVSEELLPHIFYAAPSQVDTFFTKEFARRKMLLTKTKFREGYDSGSEGLGKFFPLRSWRGVSPLQAAALTLDEFLLMKLLRYILINAEDTEQNLNLLRLEALKQLKEIWNRIPNLERENGAFTPSCNNNALDEKKTVENEVYRSYAEYLALQKKILQASYAGFNPKEYADFAEYGADVKKLLNLYEEFFALYDKEGTKPVRDRNLPKLNKLWDLIGHYHKKLSRYILQEMFQDKPWSADLDFTSEPARSELRKMNGELLDLDTLESGLNSALYKGDMQHVSATDMGWWACVGSQFKPRLDAEAIYRLYEARKAGLGRIIKALETLESTLVLVADDKNTKAKPA